MSDINPRKQTVTGFFNVSFLFMVGTEVLAWATLVEAPNEYQARTLGAQRLIMKYPNATGISATAEGLSAFDIGKIVQKYGDWN